LLSRDSAASPWLLRDVGPKQPTEPTDPFEIAAKGGFLMYLQVAWSFAEIPLTDLVKTRGVTLKKVAAVEHDGRSLVELDFEYSPPSGAPSPSSDPRYRSSLLVVRGGRILCDRSRFWAVQEFEAHGIQGISGKGSIAYGEGPNGVPVVRSVTHTLQNPQNGSTILRADFDPIAFRAVTEREFTLSAFGLPEPVFRSPHSGWPSWVFFFGVGGLCLAIAAYLHRRTNVAERAMSQL
jgi:hypothetical protein